MGVEASIMNVVTFSMLYVMAGLVPAISLRQAQCPLNRDHRVSPLRGGPVMTVMEIRS